MPLTPSEQARLRQIEEQLVQEDDRLARLMRSGSGEGLLIMRKLRTWQLVAISSAGILTAPVGLSFGQMWPGLIGFAVAAAAFVPLLGRAIEARRIRIEQRAPQAS